MTSEDKTENETSITQRRRRTRFAPYNGWDWGEFWAEVMGTFFLMIINNGVVAVMVLMKPVSFDIFGVGIIVGCGAMIGILISVPVSGGHINPAVTLAFATLKGHPWIKVPHYIIGQYLGSFIAQIFVYAMYHDAIDVYDDGNRSAFGGQKSTGNIFATYPAAGVGLLTCVVDQIIGTAILLIGVCGVTDSRGIKVPTHLQPFLIALLIGAIVTAMGFNAGAILNPARDLAPRIFSALIGYGTKPFAPLGGHYWYLVGVIGPHIGALVGVFVYEKAIGEYLPETVSVGKRRTNGKGVDEEAMIQINVENEVVAKSV